MIKELIAWRIEAAARKLGGSMDYITKILRVSFPAFRRFRHIFVISDYRGGLPPEAYHAARIVAARDEDCGTCVQIEMNMAIKAGVSRDLLQAINRSDPATLPAPVRNVYRFVEAVVQANGKDAELRPAIIQHYGESGLVEIALAIGASRFLPICKRTLGYATHCAAVTIEV